MLVHQGDHHLRRNLTDPKDNTERNQLTVSKQYLDFQAEWIIFVFQYKAVNVAFKETVCAAVVLSVPQSWLLMCLVQCAKMSPSESHFDLMCFSFRSMVNGSISEVTEGMFSLMPSLQLL